MSQPLSLVDLEARFLRWDARNWPNDEGVRLLTNVETIDEANGVVFLCPKCFVENSKSSMGVHSIECFTPDVPLDERLPGPGRWSFDGTGLHDLTLRAGSSSILIQSGCQAHFFIRDGHVVDGNW